MTPMQTGEDRRALALAGAGVEVRSDGPDGAQRFHGHAAVFDTRTAIGDPLTWGFYEEIAPGCFTDTIAEDDQRFLLDHNSFYVVSRASAGTLTRSQDGRGLAVNSALDTRLSYVNDLVVNVDNQNITGMSFGFYTVSDEWRTERETRDGRPHDVQVRRLLAARVPEVSAVTFPAYESADAGLRAEDPVRAVGLALRSRPDAAELFQARAPHCPDLARYFQRDSVRVERPAPATAPTEPAARHAIPSEIERRNRRLRVERDAARRSWYRIEQRDDGGDDGGERTADVLIYDRIGGGFFFGGVDAAQFARELAELDVDHITLRINSPGGDVYDGLAIMNTLHAHPARVTSVVEGLAASAASFIAMAGERVEMWANAEMMIHEAWGIAIGDSTDMHAMGDRLDRIGNNIASIYARRAGGDRDEWREAMRAETWYFADEALEAGLIDAIREPPARADDDPDEPDDPDDEPEPDDDPDDRAGFRYASRRAAGAPGSRATPSRTQRHAYRELARRRLDVRRPLTTPTV